VTIYTETGEEIAGALEYLPWKLELYHGDNLVSTIEITATKEQLAKQIQSYEQIGYIVKLLQYQQKGNYDETNDG
jgi:hypothetical protein